MSQFEVDITTENRGFWTNVNRQFKKKKLAVFSLYFIFFLVLTAIFSDYIANEKPLYAIYQGKTYFPVSQGYLVDMGLSQWPKEFHYKEWRKIEFEFAVWPPIPYLPKNLDFDNAQSVSPFEKQLIKSNHLRHWLGTDELGHDILAGMIHGTRIALSVGLVSVGISVFIGILLGSLAGYFGDDRLKMSRIRLIMN
ncbi:MAG: hypothetical protein JKY33_06820, partial [Bacteroidia bacterium]|nr:hypothetical protein [Bacteroidia bacterium]